MGYSPNINEKPLKAIADHFRGIAEKEGFPIGSPVEYDLFQYEHQVPGGMMSNYKFELSQKGLEVSDVGGHQHAAFGGQLQDLRVGEPFES